MSRKRRASWNLKEFRSDQGNSEENEWLLQRWAGYLERSCVESRMDGEGVRSAVWRCLGAVGGVEGREEMREALLLAVASW